MASDFIGEHSGYLCLTQEELQRARGSEPGFPQKARKLFEYRTAREGYRINDKRMDQIENAYKMVSNTTLQCTHVCLFDQSSCYSAFSLDALNVNHMNPRWSGGGMQFVINDTLFGM